MTATALAAVVFQEGVAQGQRVSGDAGLVGYILAPDGVPVSAGEVEVRTRSGRVTVRIEPTGRFHLTPSGEGLHELHIGVRGLAPHRIDVLVPPSRTVKLPPIRLPTPVYYRVRPVSVSGEPITGLRLVRRSVDLTGGEVTAFPGLAPDIATDAEGFITFGPLPRSVTTLGLASPVLAPLRLPDLYVTGAEPLIDGGTVTLDTGATVHADVVGGDGAPLASHEVWLEDSRPLSPLAGRSARTDANGRATFDRVARGQYRLRTLSERCGMPRSSIARAVPVAGRGVVTRRLVVDGVARLRLTSHGSAMLGASVTLSPDPVESPVMPGLRLDDNDLRQMLMTGTFRTAAACFGTTDGDGRIIFESFPPGPALLSVRLPNSRYEQWVTIPETPGEVLVSLEHGLMPVLVIDAAKKRPITGASIAWSSAGARIVAQTVASGDALLEGVASNPGTLVVEARGYESVQAKLSEAPTTTVEVPLPPAPPTGLHARVVTASGEPVPEAVVEVTHQNPLEVPQIVVADANGVLVVPALPPGPLQLSARGDAFATQIVDVPVNARDGLTLTLVRGYRAAVDVELPSAEPHAVRVFNEAGSAIEDRLDVTSARSIQSSGRLSLGPLAPGRYVIEVSNGRQSAKAPVVIVDRDVLVAIR